MSEIPKEDQVWCSLCHTVLDVTKVDEHRLINCVESLQDRLDEKNDVAEIGRLVQETLNGGGFLVLGYEEGDSGYWARSSRLRGVRRRDTLLDVLQTVQRQSRG